MYTVVNWPSGLRRQFKALVRKGVGSNPTLANSFFAYRLHQHFSHSCEALAVLSLELTDCCFRKTVAPTTSYSLGEVKFIDRAYF